jgi:hypothetical protein
MAWKEMLDKPAVAGGVAGGIAGVVGSIIVALIPPLVTAFTSYSSFERSIAIEALKGGGKTPADVKALLDVLCTRKFIQGDHCQTN